MATLQQRLKQVTRTWTLPSPMAALSTLLVNRIAPAPQDEIHSSDAQWTQLDVQVHDRRTRVWIAHPERPTTMIFLHGFRGSHKGLMAVAELLTEYRVVVPDLPGYGESEPLDAPHDFQHYSDWLSAFATSLGIEQYTLAGHSYGASLALVAAGRQAPGIERLVLLEPVVNAQTWTSRLGEWFYRTATRLPPRPRQWWIVNPVVNRITTELLTTLRDREAKQRLVYEEMQNLQYAVPQVEIESFLGFYQADFEQAARRVVVPTLVIAGSRDQMTPLPTLRHLCSIVPSARLAVVNGAGHFAPMEVPDRVAENILDWASSQRS